MRAISAVIEARRTPLPQLSTWERTRHFFSKKDLPRLIGTSLSTLKLQGFIPQDFVEYEIAWGSLPYTMDALIDFGFSWDDMKRMTFKPDDFKTWEFRHYHQLGVDASKMMETCMTVHDLVSLSLTPQQLHELQWTWNHMRAIGATPENINMSISDRNMYFPAAVSSAQTSNPVIVGRSGLKF